MHIRPVIGESLGRIKDFSQGHQRVPVSRDAVRDANPAGQYAKKILSRCDSRITMSGTNALVCKRLFLALFWQDIISLAPYPVYL